MVEKLSAKLGYRFKDSRLLMTALTHPSYGGDHRVPHYQRLEFLGDAVLELIVSQYLYSEHPEIDEGKLTRIRAAIVCEESLYSAAKRLGLGELIRLSVGEERSGGREKPSILADVFEAVLAAVYLDGGFDEANRIVRSALDAQLHQEMSAHVLDAKSQLQEVLQQDGKMPVYEFVTMEGPPHAPRFYYRVCEGENVLGVGDGTSKQSAQQAAAKDALKRMGALS